MERSSKQKPRRFCRGFAFRRSVGLAIPVLRSGMKNAASRPGRQFTCRSLQHRIIISMRTDPEPQQAVVDLDGKRAVAQADANAMVAADLLEMQ